MENKSHNQVGWIKKIGYGAGHVLNDMCGAMWFTYALIFFHRVLEFNPTQTGALFTIGQAAGGLSTAFVGFVSDSQYNLWLCNRYGRRKSWHLIGTLFVLLSYVFIFSPCVQCSNTSRETQAVYFGAFIVLFQFGWSAVQISHLAIIPKLTPIANERTALAAIRHIGTVVSTLVVYCILWLFFGNQNDRKVDPSDASIFQETAIITLALGSIATGIFHYIIHPKSIVTSNLDNIEANERTTLLQGNKNQGSKNERISIFTWLKKPQFYQVGILYLFTRLFVYVSQGYIPLYLDQTLNLGTTSIAVIPIVMFLAGISSAAFTKRARKMLGRNLAFAVYCVIAGCACLWINWGDAADDTFTGYEIYMIAILIGIGGSGMRILGLSVTSDLIGNNTDSSAFIYGSMSLLDKIGNGIAIMLIQQLAPKRGEKPEVIGLYFKNVLFLVCGSFTIGGLLSALFLSVFSKSKSKNTDQNNIEKVEGDENKNNTDKVHDHGKIDQ